MLTRNKKYHLTEIINYMKETDCQYDNFCLYGKYTDDELTSDGEYFISDYPDVKNDKEIYPLYVQQNELFMLYYGEQFADVISVASEEKPSATIDEYVRALNYYAQNDNFLNL